MQRKLDIEDLNVPSDDVECWHRYPKHRWVYELSRLLDAQDIKWCPFETINMQVKYENIVIQSVKPIVFQTGYIYTSTAQDDIVISEVFLIKGEIRHFRHVCASTNKEISPIIGSIELHINAFVTLYFQKFTGIISIHTSSNKIVRISLKPYCNITLETDTHVVKLVKRMYKKTDLTISGLKDHVSTETLAS